MNAATRWSTQTYAGRPDGDSHKAYRLPKNITDELEAIARGYDSGDAGLRSLFVADVHRQAGLTSGGGKSGDADSVAAWQRADQETADRAMLEAAGEAIDAGHNLFVPPMIGGPLRMFDAERWCDMRLEVEPSDRDLWQVARRNSYKRRERVRHALDAIRTFADGHAHVATLHVVYGFPDPFIATLPLDVVRRWNDDAVHPLAGLARYTEAVETVRQELVSDHPMSAWADRVTSSTDAIRWALRPHLTRDEDADDAEHQASLARHRARREAFITDVKLDASRMLKDASEALREAWRAT